MRITFDPAKNRANIDKHGVSFSDAAELDWENALVWLDARNDYGELRQSALGELNGRIFSVAFVDRPDDRRIISLRKANLREVKYYDEQT